MWDIGQCRNKKTVFWKVVLKWKLCFATISKHSLSKHTPAEVAFMILHHNYGSNQGHHGCADLIPSGLPPAPPIVSQYGLSKKCLYCIFSGLWMLTQGIFQALPACVKATLQEQSHSRQLCRAWTKGMRAWHVTEVSKLPSAWVAHPFLRCCAKFQLKDGRTPDIAPKRGHRKRTVRSI